MQTTDYVSSISCGATGLHDLINPTKKGLIQALVEDIHESGVVPAFVLFSDVASTKRKLCNGDKVQKLIEENGLGSVVVSSRRRNRNSGNFIKMYIWETNQTAKTEAEKLAEKDDNHDPWY